MKEQSNGSASIIPTIPTNQDLSPAAIGADFALFLKLFQSTYAYLDRAEKPWLSWEARYQAPAKKAVTREAFGDVLAEALSELHDFHAEVRSSLWNRWLPVPTFADLWAEMQDKAAVVTAVRKGSDAQRAGVHRGDRIVRVDAEPVECAVAGRLTPDVDQTSPQARAWALLSVLAGRSEDGRTLTLMDTAGDRRTVFLPVDRRFDRPPGELTCSLMPDNIGVIRFNNSLGEQTTVAMFDEALLLMRRTRGLILDLRDVPSGGTSSVALGILGRFVTRMLPYQRHRIPIYGLPDVERNWYELVAPRGPFSYTAPVVVLVCRWTGSMGEGLAMGFDAMQRALVIGTQMAGLAGAVSEHTLPWTGVSIAFATEQIWHPNGTRREHWLPPILEDEDFECESKDAILLRGLAELSAQCGVQDWPRAPQGKASRK